jgi:mono/diheme cytochrome c family protein
MVRSPFLVAAAVAAFAAGCDRKVANGSVDGAQVFAAACASCHGPRGEPSESMIASLRVRDLTDPAFRARATRDLIVNQVRHGSANKLMPSFTGALDDAQMAAVADFVLTLPVKTVPAK